MAVTLTDEMIQGAINAQNMYGVPASVMLGQIMLESGGNYSGGLSGLAYNYNNLFGVKSGSSWKGESVSLPTTEYQNGTPYTTNANFRVYGSINDSIQDHAVLLNKPIYTNKTAGAKSLEEYVQAMGSVYATDPEYSTKLLNVINSNNLTRYDNGNYSVSGTTAPQYVNSSTNDGKWWHDIVSNIIKICAIAFLVIMAVVFFMSAFDVKIPTKKNIADKVKKKTTAPEKKEKVTVKITEGGKS